MVLGHYNVHVVENFHCMQVWKVLETLLRQGTLQNHSRNILMMTCLESYPSLGAMFTYFCLLPLPLKMQW